MTIQPSNLTIDSDPEDELSQQEEPVQPRRRFSLNLQKYWLIITLVAFLAGSFGGFGVGRYSVHREMAAAEQSQSQYIDALADEINPPDGYQLPARFGNIGPQLVAAGVID
ncbi:MAG: hypothetical protein ABIL11_05310, partial [Chloroflexota bacterium]